MITADPVKKTVVIMMAVVLGTQACSAAEDRWQMMRSKLVDEIQADMKSLTSRYFDKSVVEAMREVERHEFVPSTLKYVAYQNRPLPIGREQTISQPFIVALMTDLLVLKSSDRVLEIGTGSGYQAAVLAEICDEVYSIEIIGALASEATGRLMRLGYTNVFVKHGDGMLGWPEKAPFDGIIVTAAGLEIPSSLVSQLKIGGRLVIPVGAPMEVQQLKVIVRTTADYTEEDVLRVRFVPITDKVR